MELIKNNLKMGGRGKESNRGGEFDKCTLYACMEIPQCNPFVQLINTNKGKRKEFMLIKFWYIFSSC
jgi:hypothetical protein